MITPRIEKIKHKFLHVDELSFVHSHGLSQQIALLTLLWSAKEAMFKWWGNGEVDFSEVLRTEPFAFNDRGSFLLRSLKIICMLRWIFLSRCAENYVWLGWWEIVLAHKGTRHGLLLIQLWSGSLRFVQ
jgi:hypothetical protein